MKAVVSDKIYMSVDESTQTLIDKELTYSIPTYNPLDPPLIIKNMKGQNGLKVKRYLSTVTNATKVSLASILESAPL